MFDLPAQASGEVNGAVRRRLVGAALRRYRQHAGYGLDEAAKVLLCDRSKVSRIETGLRGIRARDLRDLLTEYGVSEGEQAALSVIADPRNARHGWWRDYADIIPAARLDLMIMETAASEIFIYDPQQIPDLLQTPGYARAIAGSGAGSARPGRPGALGRLAEMSVTRQQVVVNERRTAVTAVIGEAALRQQAGTAAIMAGQVRWLADVTGAFPWVSVQILPSGTWTPPQRTGPMSILRFAAAPGLGVVHISGPDGGVYLIDQAAVASYFRAFTQLQASALSAQQSQQLVRDMGAAS